MTATCSIITKNNIKCKRWSIRPKALLINNITIRIFVCGFHNYEGEVLEKYCFDQSLKEEIL